MCDDINELVVDLLYYAELIPLRPKYQYVFSSFELFDATFLNNLITISPSRLRRLSLASSVLLPPIYLETFVLGVS